ncbi:MAG: DUF3135 domain-containing protein [Chromatiales bacterium]|jgi:hypothetical protein
MNIVNHNRLDFDHLTELAQSNPSEFERLRMDTIESYITTLPAERQQRMRRLQWRIDQERRNSSPMGACLKLSKMMWDHLLGPGGLIGLLHGHGPGDRQQASVIPLPAPQRPLTPLPKPPI